MSRRDPVEVTARQADHAARLAEGRHLALRRLADLRAEFSDIAAASVNSNSDDEHDPEGATIGFERAQVSALIGQAERHLADLDAAEARLVERRFELCEVCGELIGAARLLARPVARTCITCASRAW